MFTITNFGKAFVLLQFVGSTMLLGVIAFGIYPHRNNPTAKIEQGGKLQSTIERYDARIKDELASGRDRAEQRFREAEVYLRTVEAQRPVRQQLYDLKLAIARTGLDQKGNRVAQPVTKIEYDQNGLVKFANVPAIQHRGVDARSYQEIIDALAALHRNIPGNPMLGDIPALQRDIAQTISNYKERSLEILGDPQRDVRGLRREKELQEEAKAAAVRQQEYLKPLLANRYAETLLLLQRQNALLSRKQELQRIGVAVGDRPEK
jgi:hypothetical protein